MRKLLIKAGISSIHDWVETTEEFGETVQFHWVFARKPG
jgi:hypothetical protein